jgi:hypothetical protein
MNTHTFDNHYGNCPICQRSIRTKSVKAYIGLFICPFCQERVVVCKSGHYVRDPFTWRQIILSSMLRRQSRPLARIVRDFVLIKHTSTATTASLIALALGSAIVFTIISATQQITNSDHKYVPKKELVKKIPKSFSP